MHLKQNRGCFFRVNLLRDQKTDKEYVGEMIVNIKAYQGFRVCHQQGFRELDELFECKIIVGNQKYGFVALR